MAPALSSESCTGALGRWAHLPVLRLHLDGYGWRASQALREVAESVAKIRPVCAAGHLSPRQDERGRSRWLGFAPTLENSCFVATRRSGRTIGELRQSGTHGRQSGMIGDKIIHRMAKERRRHNTRHRSSSRASGRTRLRRARSDTGCWNNFSTSASFACIRARICF
jgi:hypothetical protein